MESIDFTYIDERLINILGGKEKFLELPIFEITKPVTSSSDYIDAIKYDDVSHPIMRGIDKLHRHFIVFKIQFTKRFGTTYGTVVPFQKYLNEFEWSTASNPRGDFIFLFGPKTNYGRLGELVSQGYLENVDDPAVYNEHPNDPANAHLFCKCVLG